MTCVYDGHERAFCPIILGHSQGQKKVLVYQFSGGTSGGPLSSPDWKCFFLSRMRKTAIHDGRWRSGACHRTAQTCVDVVDLDVNPSSPYLPRRRLLQSVSREAKRK